MAFSVPFPSSRPFLVFARFWSELMRICGRHVFFFVRLTAGKYETFATMVAFFLEPWKGLGSSVFVSETHGNIACC